MPQNLGGARENNTLLKKGLDVSSNQWIVGAVFILIAGYTAFISGVGSPAETYFFTLSPDGKGERYYVPDNIVRMRDCKAFYAFRNSKIPAPLGGNIHCPWGSKSDVGEFIINGETLRIPRKYLNISPNMDEGDVGREPIFLMFNYPEMTPQRRFDLKNLRQVRIELAANDLVPYPDEKVKLRNNGLLRYYIQTSLVTHLANGMTFDRLPAKTGHDQVLGLDHYRLPPTSKSGLEEPADLYVSGDVRKPKKWLYCKRLCKTGFAYNERVIVYAVYAKNFLSEHQKIEDAVIKFLDGLKRKHP